MIRSKYIILLIIIIIAMLIGLIICYFVHNNYGIKKNIIKVVIRKIGCGDISPKEGIYIFNNTIGAATITLNATACSDYEFYYWCINNSIIRRETPITLKVNGNTTVEAVFKRAYFYVRFNGNGPIIINGTFIRPPYIIRYKDKVSFKVSISPFIEGNVLYRPIGVMVNNTLYNSTFFLYLSRENLTIYAVYEQESLEEGILITSNHANFAFINGKTIRLPTVLKKGVLHGNWSVYLNETHSWWLGWYAVTYRNGTIKYYSYYKYPAVTLNKEMKQVEIHYVLGLRGLPYVRRIWYFPPYSWNHSGDLWTCYAKLKDHKLIFYNFTNPEIRPVIVDVFLEFDWNVSGIWLWWRSYGGIVVGGWEHVATFNYCFRRFHSNQYIMKLEGIVQNPNMEHILYINETCAKLSDGRFARGVFKLGFYAITRDLSDERLLPLPEMEGRYGIFMRFGWDVRWEDGETVVVEIRILGVNP